jgi:murein DD-endopeptidase MepM/ murein hydrolase activator NlpD
VRSLVFFILISFPLCCLGQLTDAEIYDLKGGRVKNDTSYVYWLPYESGKRYLLVQASNSKMSHRDELSADFKMKTGESICAAREGIIIDFRSNSDKGGLQEENLADGNFVKVQHADGSIAKYWHLQKNGVEVKVGDKVQKGQVIGKSGNTGYTAFPHLHFQVIDKSGKQILTRFQTKKGIKYLRPGKWYRCVHVEQSNEY